MRGGIDRSASKGDNEDDVDSWDEYDFDVDWKEGAEWGTTKGTRTTTKRVRRRRRRRKSRGGGAAADNAKEDEVKKEENLSLHAKHIKRLNT